MQEEHFLLLQARRRVQYALWDTILLLQHLHHVQYALLEDMALQPAFKWIHVLGHVPQGICVLRDRLINTEELLQAALDLVLKYVLLDTGALVLV